MRHLLQAPHNGSDANVSDIPIFLVCILASTTTVLLICVQIVWFALLFSLRKRGCRVTHLHHNWEKIRETISGVESPSEKRKYEHWLTFLQYAYVIWATTMTVFVLLTLFIVS